MGAVKAVQLLASGQAGPVGSGGVSKKGDSKSFRERCCTIQEVASVIIFLVNVVGIAMAFVYNQPYVAIPFALGAVIQIIMHVWIRNVKHLKDFGQNNKDFKTGIGHMSAVTTRQAAAVDRHDAVTTRQERATADLATHTDTLGGHAKQMGQSATHIETNVGQLLDKIQTLETNLNEATAAHQSQKQALEAAQAILSGMENLSTQERALMTTFNEAMVKLQSDGKAGIDQIKEASRQLEEGLAKILREQQEQQAKEQDGRNAVSAGHQAAMQEKIGALQTTAQQFQAFFTTYLSREAIQSQMDSVTAMKRVADRMEEQALKNAEATAKEKTELNAEKAKLVASIDQLKTHEAAMKKMIQQQEERLKVLDEQNARFNDGNDRLERSVEALQLFGSPGVAVYSATSAVVGTLNADGTGTILPVSNDPFVDAAPAPVLSAQSVSGSAAPQSPLLLSPAGTVNRSGSTPSGTKPLPPAPPGTPVSASSTPSRAKTLTAPLNGAASPPKMGVPASPSTPKGTSKPASSPAPATPAAKPQVARALSSGGKGIAVTVSNPGAPKPASTKPVVQQHNA